MLRSPKIPFLSLEMCARGSSEFTKRPETRRREHLGCGALNQAQGIPALGQGLRRGRGIGGRALHISKRKLQKPLKAAPN